MSQVPNNETASDASVNPYASSHSESEVPIDLARLKLPAWIAIVCCVISLGLWLLTLIVSLPYGNPNAPPLIQILGFIGMFIVLPGLALAGAVSMINRKRYVLALIGASCMLVPVFGPCFGLTIPVGIWSLILLRRQSIRNSFASSHEHYGEVYGDADDAMAAASKLDLNGEWDAAITRYQSIAAHWPEHAKYIENCVDEIRKKQNAAR